MPLSLPLASLFPSGLNATDATDSTMPAWPGTTSNFVPACRVRSVLLLDT